MIDSTLRWLSVLGHATLRRIINLLICIDQLVFCIITLGSSAPDETISSAAYRLELQGRLPGKVFRPLIDKIMFFDPNHCRKAYRAEINGWQRPKRTT